jgi:hypothetical protein
MNPAWTRNCRIFAQLWPNGHRVDRFLGIFPIRVIALDLGCAALAHGFNPLISAGHQKPEARGARPTLRGSMIIKGGT